MCELLGLSSRKRRRRNDLLREFYSHAQAHPHGWGLARFPDGGAPSVEKEPVCATHSAFLAGLLAAPVEERSLIAHIRLATIGHIEYENCHPFTAADNIGRTWTLAHNGTIFSDTALNDYMGIQYGDTDSERVLLHLIGRINVAQNHRRHALDEAERFSVLSAEKQSECVAAFKAAARLDFDWTPVGELMERMGEFFAASAGWPVSVQRILAYQAEKVYSPERRYARMEACHV